MTNGLNNDGFVTTDESLENELILSPYIGEIEMKEKKLSEYLPFQRYIFIVSPELLGTHEAYIPEKSSKLDLSQGWYGDPLSVTTFSPRLLNALAYPGIYTIEGLEYGELGLLDGHHRRQAAIFQRSKVVVQLFFADSPNLVIETWGENDIAPSMEEIELAFKSEHTVFPPRATKFKMLHTDGNRYPLTYFQPKIILPGDAIRN
jgi:hypothetical protein